MLKSIFVAAFVALFVNSQNNTDPISVIKFIKVNDFDNSLGACVAVAISKNVLLTSAACVTRQFGREPLGPKQILLGTEDAEADIKKLGNVANNLSLPGSQYFNPSKVIVHENYNQGTFSDNIAILIVSDKSLAGIKMYKNVPKADSALDAYGVNQLMSSSAQPTDKLVTGTVGVLPEYICAGINPSFNGSSDRLMCASARSVCALDGAVLVDNNGDDLLIGLGSFIGAQNQPRSGLCTNPESVIFYTSPQFYAEWIVQNARVSKSVILSDDEVEFESFSSKENENSTDSNNDTNSTNNNNNSNTTTGSDSSSNIIIPSTLFASILLALNFF